MKFMKIQFATDETAKPNMVVQQGEGMDARALKSALESEGATAKASPLDNKTQPK